MSKDTEKPTPKDLQMPKLEQTKQLKNNTAVEYKIPPWEVRLNSPISALKVCYTR